MNLYDDPRVVYLLEALFDALHTGKGGIEVTVHFDDGMDFLALFNEKFPGNRPDGNLTRTKERVYRLLARMEKMSWVRRRMNTNHGFTKIAWEPKWVNEWRITPYGIEVMKGMQRGKS